MQPPHSLLQFVLGGVAALCAGRVLLAWLPPGSPHAHDWHALPATMSASLLLGLACLAAVGSFELAGITQAGIVIFVVLVLGWLRTALAPAAMIPRHEPALVPRTWVERGATLASCIVIALAPAGRAVDWTACAVSIAALFLVIHVLDVARCPGSARALGAIFFALVLAALRPASGTGPEAFSALFFCAGAACTVPWLRRGDRRSLTLAVIFHAAALLCASGAWTLSAAGLGWLAIGTPRPSRFRTAGLGLVFLLVAVSIRRFGAPIEEPAASSAATSFSLILAAVLFLIVAAARWHDVRHARATIWNPSGARVGHEEAILLRTIVTALVFALAARRFAPELPACDAILPSMLVLALIAGLSFKRFATAPAVRTIA